VVSVRCEPAGTSMSRNAGLPHDERPACSESESVALESPLAVPDFKETRGSWFRVPGQKAYARQCLTDSSGRTASGVSTSRIDDGRVATA